MLTVVIPLYNEEGAAHPVVTAWDDQLARLGIDYELRVYDDGSRDATGSILEKLARERTRVIAVRQTNRGHGPTILRGYREARGEWVFQVDGDDEMSPASFPGFWSRREEADLVIGCRSGRELPVGRRIISVVSRTAVRLLFGPGVRDVNVPYRLYRRTALAEMLALVPEKTFAPNVILVGLAVSKGLRIVELPVPYRTRQTGESSLGRLRMWTCAATAFWQTLRVAMWARSQANLGQRGSRAGSA